LLLTELFKGWLLRTHHANAIPGLGDITVVAVTSIVRR
jgi:hypothetical protein